MGQRVGFAGAGWMECGMAACLVRKGHSAGVSSPFRAKAEEGAGLRDVVADTKLLEQASEVDLDARRRA